MQQETICERCDGWGEIENLAKCLWCDGSGYVLTPVVPAEPSLPEQLHCLGCGKQSATRDLWEVIEGGSVNCYHRETCPCGFVSTNDIFS